LNKKLQISLILTYTILANCQGVYAKMAKIDQLYTIPKRFAELESTSLGRLFQVLTMLEYYTVFCFSVLAC